VHQGGETFSLHWAAAFGAGLKAGIWLLNHTTDVGCKYDDFVNSRADALEMSVEDRAVYRTLSVLHGKSHSWTCAFLYGVAHCAAGLGHHNGEVRLLDHGITEGFHTRLASCGCSSFSTCSPALRAFDFPSRCAIGAQEIERFFRRLGLISSRASHSTKAGWLIQCPPPPPIFFHHRTRHYKRYSSNTATR